MGKLEGKHPLYVHRERHFVSREELAETMHYSISYIEKVETGNLQPSIKFLEEYADGFDISLKTLLNNIEAWEAKKCNQWTKVLKLVRQRDD